MSWIKSFGIILFSILIGFLIAEVILRIDGRYTDLANGEIGGTNKIWTRFPNTTLSHSHPDLDFKVQLIYDSIGARQSNHDIDKSEKIIGVFGDSYTENKRVKDEFTFTEILNEISDSGSFINFGVDGYGLEQSFQHWLDKKDLLSMDAVLYVFCANDLRNTYEAKIFDRKAMQHSEVINLVSTSIPLHIKVASKMHLTYLFIESWYKAKSIIVDKSDFYKNLHKQFSNAKEEYKNRFHDEYADALVMDYLKEVPSKKSIDIAHHFQRTLVEWSNQVQAEGGELIVVVLPRKIERALGQKLIPDTIVTINLEGNDAFKILGDKDWRFKNDNHWNEYGNLSGALSLRKQLQKEGLNEFFSDRAVNDYVAKKVVSIDLLYESK